MKRRKSNGRLSKTIKAKIAVDILINASMRFLRSTTHRGLPKIKRPGSSVATVRQWRSKVDGCQGSGRELHTGDLRFAELLKEKVFRCLSARARAMVLRPGK